MQDKKKRHVVNALFALTMANPERANDYSKFIIIDNAEPMPGVAASVKFTIQSDPVSVVGVNGIQAVDMLEYVSCLFSSLNDAFPCKENADTLEFLKKAIERQHDRTRDRIARNVEGINAQ